MIGFCVGSDFLVYCCVIVLGYTRASVLQTTGRNESMFLSATSDFLSAAKGVSA